MPVFQLSKKIVFPSVRLSEPNGILAVGGDLSPERIIEAYRNGIFPWYSEGDPIIWWSPDPRFAVKPGDVKVSKTMRQVLRRDTFRFTADTCFEHVMRQCSLPRKHERGTWINEDMIEAYTQLHSMGIAHSVEAWHGDELAGGLYGISLGRMFFGESMFTRVPNASKAAFITLAGSLEMLNFDLIDCQVYTSHLESLGAADYDREYFLSVLSGSLEKETLSGNWGNLGVLKKMSDPD